MSLSVYQSDLNTPNYTPPLGPLSPSLSQVGGDRVDRLSGRLHWPQDPEGGLCDGRGWREGPGGRV